MAVQFFSQNYLYQVFDLFVPASYAGKDVPELVTYYRDLNRIVLIQKKYHPMVKAWLDTKLRTIESVILRRMRAIARGYEGEPFDRMITLIEEPLLFSGPNSILVDNPKLSFQAKRRALIDPSPENWPRWACSISRGYHNDEQLLAFLAIGADPNIRNVMKETPVYWIRSEKVLEKFISKGADVDARDWAGCTALMRQARLSVLTTLVNAKADVNACSDSGYSVLHHLFCIPHDKRAITELFISHGAKVNALDNQGHTPLDVIHDEEVREVLLTHGARPATLQEKRYSKVNIRRAKIATLTVMGITTVVFIATKMFFFKETAR